MQRYEGAQSSYSPKPSSRNNRLNDRESVSVAGSASLRSKTPQVVLDSFSAIGDPELSDEDIPEFSGHCYLKTKTESYKKHWMVLQGNELRFFRKQGDEEHKVMHCLAGTYLKEVSMEEISEKSKSSAAPSRASTVKSSNASSNDESKRAANLAKSKNFHPIKLVIPPNKSRLIFFSKQDD